MLLIVKAGKFQFMKNTRESERQAFAERLQRAFVLSGGREYGKYSELARAFGVTPHAVKRWFLAQTIPTGRISAIAEHLGVRAEWLLSGSGPMREVEARLPSGEAVQVEVHRIPIIEPANFEQLQNPHDEVSSYCFAIGRFSKQTFAYELPDNALLPQAVSGMIAVVDPDHPDAAQPSLSRRPVVVFDGGAFYAGRYVVHGSSMIEPLNQEYRSVQLSPSHQVVGVICSFSQRDI